MATASVALTGGAWIGGVCGCVFACAWFSFCVCVLFEEMKIYGPDFLSLFQLRHLEATSCALGHGMQMCILNNITPHPAAAEFSGLKVLMNFL